MAKVIAINAGSSSLKWKLFDMPAEKVIASGMVDRVGLKDSVFTVHYGPDNKEKFQKTLDINDQNAAVKMLLEELINLKIVKDIHEISGVGHRVVAGGEIFTESTIVDDKVEQQINDLAEYAPLHNPAELMGIQAFRKLLPEATSVAAFDTSFHHTMPAVNYLYSIPYEYYEKYGARKYGAHGTSHRYVSARAAEILGKPLKDLKLITLHLGAGASITAVKDGKSYDTSMGFTPLAGITMATRSGDIDASLMAYLMEKLNISDPEKMIDILNHKSGILGISGLSPDMRDLEKTRDTRKRSQLGIDIFVNRIQKYVGSYVAEMGGVDALVFTAGIGENDMTMRKRIIDGLGYFGAKIDDERNNVMAQERIISTDDSKTKVLLVPTNEELMIARDVVRLSK
ncbi:acetate/propionate family kinase [Loigolactobacillus backii]|uniref:Acetate kinase n=1 Tax=Loigolactobacillus backii TaxID=375175 RepID=A0A192H4U2_9LACO|nr:acetate kinase [Loigolactobacillus backii]ANK59927.1 acetate kinase [Loigolactobacillus backii]ANK63263.1 acetate kinase [Loigolactobacillus backii]ANK66692.1 acetate kinase [Loigolactobacillus backii]ANK69731.1 acetate kinase [Loigolactobacillus backii]MDA5386635.1 acetate kinase [Loigolactobacillus backii]